jgi:ankyrin repeat protein
MTRIQSASKENMTRRPIPSEIFILIAGYLEPEACYPFIQGIHGLDDTLPAKEFGRLSTRSGNTIIHFAAQRGDLRLIQSLHFRGLDVNIKNRHGVTPLAAASRRGHRSLVEFLISIGAKVDSQDKRGLTPLHNACYHGADDIVQILLDNGADPFLEANLLGTTALDWACKSGHVSTVALLLTCLKDLEEIPATWESALEIAARKGRTAVVQLLVGANFVISDGVFHQAGVSGQAKIVKLLLTHRKQFRERSNDDELRKAISWGYPSTVKVLIEHGQRIGNDNDAAASSLGRTGSVKILRALLQAGTNFSETRRREIVQLAATFGNTAMVQYLVRLGWVTPAIGKEALISATSYGHAAMVKILLDKWFKFDPKKPKEQEHAFTHASYVGHLEVLNLFPGSVAPMLLIYPAVCKREISLVRELLSSKIDTSSTDYFGQRRLRISLWKAVENGDTEMVQLLLDAGVPPEAQGYGEGKPSALYRAAKGGFIDIVKLLVQAGADISHENHKIHSAHGYTALYVATTCRHQDVMKYLIESGASVSFRGAEGHTALHAAARSSCPSSVTLLLEAGANVSAEAFCGRTPLHYAAQYGRLEAIELLLRAGADPSVRNRRGQSPWDVAMEYDHEETATVLKAAGGYGK